jgi:sulfur transfer complex TusBCD TusB component (DsrH family)
VLHFNFFFCSFFLFLQSAVFAAVPEGYSSEKGAHVAILATHPPTDDKVLIWIDGTHTYLDGKAYVHTIKKMGDGSSRFFMKYEGNDFLTVNLTPNTKPPHLLLYLPERKGELVLKADPEWTKTIVAEKILLRHRHQKKSEAEENQELTKSIAEAKKSCGGKIDLAVDNSSFKSKPTISSALACSDVFSGLGWFCKKGPEYEGAVKEKFKKVNCVLGSATHFSLGGSTLTATVPGEGGEVDNATIQWLGENL